MSLETKIEQLTKAIEALTAQVTTIQMLNNIDPKPVAEIKPVKFAEKKEKVEQAETVDTGITAESLRDMCLSIVRNDRSKRAAIKDLMRDEFNATVVDDIDAKDFAKFKQMLEAL